MTSAQAVETVSQVVKNSVPLKQFLSRIHTGNDTCMVRFFFASADMRGTDRRRPIDAPIIILASVKPQKYSCSSAERSRMPWMVNGCSLLPWISESWIQGRKILPERMRKLLDSTARIEFVWWVWLVICPVPFRFSSV